MKKKFYAGLMVFFSLALLTESPRCESAEKNAPFPTSIKVLVTGNPATQSVIEEAVMEGIEKDTYLGEGTSVKMSLKELSSIKGLYKGDVAIVNIPVKVRRLSFADIEDTIKVAIINEETPPKEEDDFLVVSNDPEEIEGTGMILEHSFNQGNSIRLLYHHYVPRNRSSKYLIVSVLNNSKKPAKIHLVKGISGPDIDEIYVGHKATCDFLKNWVSNAGRILEIQPGYSEFIVNQNIKEGQIVSGLLKLHLLEGEKVTVRILAKDQETAGIVHNLEVEPKKLHGRVVGVFDETQRDIFRAYTIGSNFKVLRIGNEPFIADMASKRELKGNYGLIYNITLSIFNPDPREKKQVALNFAPAGGIARGLFIIPPDNVLESILLDPRIQNKKEANLMTLEIEPSSFTTVKLITIPQAGAYYPVKLVLEDRKEMLSGKTDGNNISPVRIE